MQQKKKKKAEVRCSEKKYVSQFFWKGKKVKGREVFQRLGIEIENGMKNERGDGRSWAENEIEWDGN